MGNLTYVPPKLVPLSGVKLAEPRPADAAASRHLRPARPADGPSLRVLPAARDALLAQYAAQDFRPIWLEDGKLSDRGAAVLKLLAAADEEGLEPQGYLPPASPASTRRCLKTIPPPWRGSTSTSPAAALRYARDASGGQFDPAPAVALP